MDRKAYRISEVAEQLGISQRTCWRLIKEGQLKARTPDKGSRFRLGTSKARNDYLSEKDK